jgi:NDP-sugar pyrophosphorylase family protein
MDNRQEWCEIMFDTGLILAGGRGKRLRPLTNAVPKPLLPIGDKPIIQGIIERMERQGIKNIYISVNYKRELIKNYLGDGSKYGVEIKYIEETNFTGTAGCLRLLRDDIQKPFIMSNGDVICDVSYHEIYDFLKNGFDLVVVGVKKEFSIDFGVLDIDQNFELVSWEEKPIIKNIINAGIYAVTPGVLDFIKKLIKYEEYFDMPSLWKEMKKHKMRIGVYIHEGEWYDVGRMKDYMTLNGEELN